MNAPKAKSYPPGHWLRSGDPEEILKVGARQHGLTYSRVKNEFFFELLGVLSGKTLLDFGCGSGYFALEALRRGAERVYALDALPQALTGAALLAERAGKRVKLDLAAASEPCFKPEVRFDLITLRDVIEHLPDDLGLLRRLASHLNPGGRLVLSTQNSFSLNFLLEGGARRILLGQKDWLGWDTTHLRFYTPWTLARLLCLAGLRPCQYRGAYVLPHKLPTPWRADKAFQRIESLARLDRVLGRAVPGKFMGFSLIVEARSEKA